jgi:type II secretory pathway pseudopilin PulG
MHNYSNSKPTRASSSFSLIDLLIVAIILIIAAIAIPSLLRSRTSENQAPAVVNLRTVTTSLVRPLQNNWLCPGTENQHSDYRAPLLGEDND